MRRFILRNFLNMGKEIATQFRKPTESHTMDKSKETYTKTHMNQTNKN